MSINVFICITLVVVGDAFLLIPNAPRSVVKILAVGNGGPWGSWYQPQYCPSGSYAVGYNMKIQDDQREHDDTCLNAISLHCEPLNMSTNVGDITSEQGGWGSWVGLTSCSDYYWYHERSFLTSFALQVESNRFGGDDTAANFVKFMCRDFNTSYHEHELTHYPGHGPWGTYGDWSQSCPLGSAICGIQTKVEPFQGDSGLFGGDDTALNDVQFMCCNDTAR
ncbi:hypothetical protein ACJMK2_027756 [Sinanodonta woodiana]|uniref:Vitelline membrane outer layer protein 1 n=1 Tax=Sinanodonta woodiana TaxID=1069815 RepID=A0ABD3X8H9_SINWO